MIYTDNSAYKRSAVYRLFKKNNINIIPKEQKEKVKKFKELEPKFLQLDVNFLLKSNEKQQHLYVLLIGGYYYIAL